MSVLTLKSVSSSVRGGKARLYKGWSKRADNLDPFTGMFLVTAASWINCLFFSPRWPWCSVRLSAWVLSPGTATLSREWEEMFELGSLLKSWRIRRVCLLGRLCLPQLWGSSSGVCEQEQPLLPCLSSFGNKSIIMCIEHAMRKTMRIKKRNLRRRIIFMVSFLSR